MTHWFPRLLSSGFYFPFILHLYLPVPHCLLHTHSFIQQMLIKLYFISFSFLKLHCARYRNLDKQGLLKLSYSWIPLLNFWLVCPFPNLYHSLRVVEMLAFTNCLLLRPLLFLTMPLCMKFLLKSVPSGQAAEFLVLKDCPAGPDRQLHHQVAGVGIGLASGWNARFLLFYQRFRRFFWNKCFSVCCMHLVSLQYL